MTSLLPSANGTWDFSDSLHEGYITLAEALRACGFATGSFVQNGNAGPYAGLAQGFDVVFDEEAFGPRAADLLDSGGELDRWIAARRGQPYFAYIHLLDPHGPFDPARRPDLAAALEEVVVARDRAIDPPWLRQPTRAARLLLYDAEIAANDAAIAAFLERLDKIGDLDRAVVVATADHGEFLGEHGGMWRHHPPGHFEVTRVPLLLHAPGAAARRIDAATGLLDVSPTLLELAGADASALPMQGHSLVPLLTGSAARPRAVPIDEMLLEQGPRRAEGCGGMAGSDWLWMMSCTSDADFVPGRAVRQASGGRQGLRTFTMTARGAAETTAHGWGHSLRQGALGRSLLALQQANIAAWRRVAGGSQAPVRSEPAQAERLRSLGYAD